MTPLIIFDRFDVDFNIWEYYGVNNIVTNLT